jgi:carboxyl-terminal processing protease
MSLSVCVCVRAFASAAADSARTTAGRSVAALAMAAAVALVPVSGVMTARGADAVAQPAANRDVGVHAQVKSQALQSVLQGKFEQTQEMLSRAAANTHDPIVARMATWIGEFQKQRSGFTAERRKSYDEAVADVRKLLDAGKDGYAIDRAKDAFGLADDKIAFRGEAWVDKLIKTSVAQAEEADAKEQWFTSLRLYADLSAIEPANPLWKERLKLATRRIRLIALYTPSELKGLQEGEVKEREQIDAILKPEATTKPTTKPVAVEEADESFRVDWKESLRGITSEMLWDALVDARTNYYRPVEYRDLMIGGLKGLQAIATTKGLEKEKAFAGLGDEAKRGAFLRAIEDQLAAAAGATATNEQILLRAALAKLKTVNRETVQLPEEVLVSEFADGAFAELDLFSSMIWPADVAEFNKSTQGEFSGVGIQIQTDEEGNLKVASPLEDSPAYKAGIKAYDIITHINGRKAKGITLNQAVKTITGPTGTHVVLTVKSPDDTVKEYNIRREVIKVASIKGWSHRPGGGWDYLVDPESKIAYVRMTNFTKSTADELESAVGEMKRAGAKGLILDLRYNPGGLLQAATEVSDRFLAGGTIVSTRADRETPNQPTEAVARDDRGGEVPWPTVVLVNQYSASASEIVAGALKDQDRALVVGERTFGKGSVQMLFPLNNRQAYLKLTTSHYYLPSGKCIHREENSQEWGVDPDLKIEMTPEQMRAAIDARQELDVLRDIQAPPAEGEQRKLEDVAPKVEEVVKEAGDPEKDRKAKEAVAAAKKDPLGSDPQLSAALLLLRMQLAGAQM